MMVSGKTKDRCLVRFFVVKYRNLRRSRAHDRAPNRSDKLRVC